MKTIDIFGYSFSAIKLRKLRAALTILGVVIGIAAIVALLSITQGLQATITTQLQKGLSTNTLIVTPGQSALAQATSGSGKGLGGAGAGGQGFNLGGSSTSSSGFNLYVNYTQQIDALSPDIVGSFAVIQRSGYVDAGGVNSSVTIYGVDFSQYAQQYSKTFVAASGTIPLSPTGNETVVGTLVNDPGQNGTLLFGAGDDIGIVWTNGTTLPVVNETYTAQVSAVLQRVGGFGVGGPSDTGVYIPLSQAESFFGTDQCDMIIVQLKSSDNATVTNVSKAITNYFGGQVSVISATAVKFAFNRFRNHTIVPRRNRSYFPVSGGHCNNEYNVSFVD
jgi:ABC-type lipoprotein release transport system permease subunit